MTFENESATAKTESANTESANTESAQTKSANTESAQHSREEIIEAARVLKSGGSKKRERRAAASVMSRTGGAKKGGENRAKNLTSEQRREIARQGGLARQAKAREEDERLGFTKPRNRVMTKREIKLKAAQL